MTVQSECGSGGGNAAAMRRQCGGNAAAMRRRRLQQHSSSKRAGAKLKIEKVKGALADSEGHICLMNHTDFNFQVSKLLSLFSDDGVSSLST